jgi:predicted DNA-binding protein YlxM (UPF0122 family)
MDDLNATREHLNKQLKEAIATNPLGTLPTIVALKQDADQHLHEAVQLATVDSSWREIADALGVSKQAAHQRFKAYEKDVVTQIKAEHRAMRAARRRGDADEAAKARARRDELTTELKTAAKDLSAELRGRKRA